MKKRKRHQCQCCLGQMNGKPAGFFEGYKLCASCFRMRGQIKPNPWRRIVRDFVREAGWIEGVTVSPLEMPPTDEGPR